MRFSALTASPPGRHRFGLVVVGADDAVATHDQRRARAKNPMITTTTNTMSAITSPRGQWDSLTSTVPSWSASASRARGLRAATVIPVVPSSRSRTKRPTGRPAPYTGSATRPSAGRRHRLDPGSNTPCGSAPEGPAERRPARTGTAAPAAARRARPERCRSAARRLAAGGELRESAHPDDLGAALRPTSRCRRARTTSSPTMSPTTRSSTAVSRSSRLLIVNEP